MADRWLSLAAAFLLLGLVHYSAHRCQHAVPWLWRFHALHHSDPDVDVTTSMRHHQIEYLIAAGFYWLAVLMLGIPVAVVTFHALAVFAAAAITALAQTGLLDGITPRQRAGNRAYRDGLTRVGAGDRFYNLITGCRGATADDAGNSVRRDLRY